MKHKLSDIFKTDNIESKRRILNRFELTKEDKADIINMSGKSNGGGSDNVQAKFYKLNKEYVSGNVGFIPLYANLFGVADMENDNGIKSYSTVPPGMLVLYDNSLLESLHTISFIPVKTRTMDTNQQFGDYVFVNTIYDVGNGLGVTKEDIDKAFIEITEEEFYNFNPNNL